ncbi:MAG: EAL domain-containing protein [Mizugakiibacter sp.]|uniref:GGDEF/EAL domain-containing response regulator n=1 Tax=Mizugakiibacter sp. TaxID=1972610 RepID=UPI0031CAD92E|nr:EAL domain-containing protein [Xanthomonadaceae bacterium]
MKQDNVTKILFIEDALEDAEQVTGMLRNGGIAVRPARAGNEAELESALESLAPDLVLANPATRDLKLGDVARMLDATGKDIVLIAMVAHADDKTICDAFLAGARALALRSRPDQMQAIVRREAEALVMRRSVRRLEAALRESERRCDALLDSSRDPIAYVHEGVHVRANKAYLEMFGFEDFEEVQGLTLLDLVAPANTEDFKALLKRLSRGEKPPPRLELKAQRADGSTFDAVMEFAQATFEGEPCIQIVFRRQEADSALAEQLDALRSRDPVTDLFNRSHMLDVLDEAVAAAAAGNTSRALLLIEPDNYRNLVDSVGLGSADSLLRALGARLAAQLDAHDIAGRISDHTFGVLLGGAEASAQAVAERIRGAVETHIFEAGTQSISLTISIGGSLIGEKNANSPTVLAQATSALRNAQNTGGNRADIHDPAAKDKAEAEKERHWLALVQHALASNGFVLYYQPVISLQGAEGEHYEILLRLRGPKGEVLPGYFLPIAERHGLLPAIDRWVIGNAIRVLAERKREGALATFFLKITPQSLEDETLAPWIGQQLAAAGVPGRALVLEMPESKVVTSLKPARAFVDALKQFGCGFALEQFGSGLNSFQLLKHIDAGYLKIDRSYMAELPKHPENQERVRELCTQAQAAGRLTVAEWVEDAASMSILFTCGVAFVQGNFLQEPEKVMAYELAG